MKKYNWHLSVKEDNETVYMAGSNLSVSGIDRCHLIRYRQYLEWTLERIIHEIDAQEPLEIGEMLVGQVLKRSKN